MSCPTCQGRHRHTTDMVCLTCGRDYLDDDPQPALGWRRLLLQWIEEGRRLRGQLADAEADLDILRAQLSPMEQAGQSCRAVGPAGAVCRLTYGHAAHVDQPHVWTDAWVPEP